MPRNLNDFECKEIIIKLGKRLNIEPKLITMRLMSEEDKNDMRFGRLPVKSLECHIKIWKENGMPNYLNEKCRLLF